MGFGADAAAGGGGALFGGQTAGFSMDVPGGASGAAFAGGGAIPGGASPGTFGGGGGGPLSFLGDMLNHIMSNPESGKALADTAGKIAAARMSANNIPPETMQGIRQGIQQAQQAKAAQDQMNPYMGDITRFITPEIAQGALGHMGIPWGRSQLY